MCSRITEIEQYLTKQTSKQQHSDIENNQNNYIAIYGLLEKHDDVTKTVNELLYEMNLRNMKCISAYRTPYRHDIQRQGVVIAEMRCTEDKREILKRKRFIRSHPVYQNVFIKSSKSHVEQVMDSNFNVVLKEMTNGNAYYISDNGRITPRNRLAYKSGHTDGYNNINYQSSGNHGGAIPKNFRDQVNQQDRYDKHQHIWNENGHPNTMYRQNRQPENRPQDFWHRHQDNGFGLQDIRRGQEYHDYQDIRKASHGIYSKKYIDKFAHLQNNQRSNNVDYTKEHMIPKN